MSGGPPKALPHFLFFTATLTTAILLQPMFEKRCPTPYSGLIRHSEIGSSSSSCFFGLPSTRLRQHFLVEVIHALITVDQGKREGDSNRWLEIRPGRRVLPMGIHQDCKK